MNVWIVGHSLSFWVKHRAVTAMGTQLGLTYTVDGYVRHD